MNNNLMRILISFFLILGVCPNDAQASETGSINITVTLNLCNGTVSGTGYYYTGRYRTQVSVNVDSKDLASGTLRYYNSRKRISFSSTAIESVDFPSAGVAVVTGAGTVNRNSGYTFTVTITDSSNTWEMTIFDSTGDTYESGSGSLSRGDLTVSTSEIE